MKRVRSAPRPNWQSIVESQGLVYGTPARDARGDDRPYWDESVYYEFEMDEILALEADVELLHSMC
ncbi:MAG: glutathionylspermidine synthase family protein, partial [Mycobacteriaceae bacterium]|nr:glutathionylspermidine synthase family protein [Mycobacteriaceae bacterium]